MLDDMKKNKTTRKQIIFLILVIATSLLFILSNTVINRLPGKVLHLGSLILPGTSLNGIVQAFISMLCFLMVCINHRRGKFVAFAILGFSIASMTSSILISRSMAPMPGIFNVTLSLISISLVSTQFAITDMTEQYHEALTEDAMTSFEANITKDIIKKDFYYINEEGKKCSVTGMVGLSTPCKFSEFVNRWITSMIPDTSKWKVNHITNMSEYLTEAYENGRKDITVEYWTILSSGKRTFLNCKFLIGKDSKNDLNILCVIRDYTVYKQEEDATYQKELDEYAYKDPITNGQNYNIFKVALKKSEISGSIICLDIQSFKVINSICGIAKGDEILKSIWDVILAGLEVSKREFAAHINADHFVIFLPTFDQEEIAHRLQRYTIALSILSEDMDIPLLQPYFGVSSWTPDKRVELSYSEAVSAKDSIKNIHDKNFAFFDEKVGIQLINQKRIIDEFNTALENEEFKIWYQPKYSPITKELIGAEALVRWKQPDGSYRPPVEFIPLFETNHMIRDLDEYVFKNVCLQIKRWKDENKKIVPISVNISRSSLYFKSVATKYKKFVEECGIDPKFIPIEITESAAVNNNEIKDIADALHNSGFALHMDDFGSGYSSLASLNTMHFETLKLDKSLIDYIGNYGGNRLIMHTISLAKELGMHITAEGVESKEQVTFLKENGCDSIQGFYYSKPVPMEEFQKLL